MEEIGYIETGLNFQGSLEELRQFTDANPQLALLVYVDLDADADACFKASLFPKTARPGAQPICQVAGGNLFEIKERVEKAWADSKENIVQQRVHQLAFTIMRLTDENGYVSNADLLANGFIEAEVSVLKERALAETQRMIERGPFKIS